jgi:hypothetical protein
LGCSNIADGGNLGGGGDGEDNFLSGVWESCFIATEYPTEEDGGFSILTT